MEFDDALEALTEIALDWARIATPAEAVARATATMVEIGRLKEEVEEAHEAAVAEARCEAYTLLGRERDAHQLTINERDALRVRIGVTPSLRSLQNIIERDRAAIELVAAERDAALGELRHARRRALIWDAVSRELGIAFEPDEDEPGQTAIADIRELKERAEKAEQERDAELENAVSLGNTLSGVYASLSAAHVDARGDETAGDRVARLARERDEALEQIERWRQSATLKAEAEAAEAQKMLSRAQEALDAAGVPSDHDDDHDMGQLAWAAACYAAPAPIRALDGKDPWLRSFYEAAKAEIESLKAQVERSMNLADNLAAEIQSVLNDANLPPANVVDRVRMLVERLGTWPVKGTWAAEIRHLQATVHGLAQQKGWWHDYIRTTDGKLELTTRDVLSYLALIHSEVSEAAEEARRTPPFELYQERLEDGKPCGLPSELADVVIRVLDLGQALGVDVGRAIVDKHSYNTTRPLRHGGKLA